jgi:hypothetical protein
MGLLPTKEVDVDFLVFVERQATDLLRWDILAFFGHNPEFYGSTTEVAQNIGRRSRTIRPDLGDLALAGVLEKVKSADGPTIYRLTRNPVLRQAVLKLAGMQLPVQAHQIR